MAAAAAAVTGGGLPKDRTVTGGLRGLDADDGGGGSAVA